MNSTCRLLLVASAVVVSAASPGAVGLDRRQQSQTQQQQSQQPQQQDQTSQQPSAQGRDEEAARQELVQAKQSLMDLTKLPEASQLQGDARTGVIQVINGFNSLVTTDTNWYDHYKEVQQQLARVLGSDVSGSGAASGAESGSVATSGTTTTDVPAPVRDKLIEFRQHLVAFGKAAGAPGSADAAGTGSTADSPASTSGMSGTSSASGQSSTASGSGQGTTGTGTQGTTTGTAGMTSASGETFQQHFDAIGDLLQQALGSPPAPTSGSTAGSSSTTGTTGTTGQEGSSATSSSSGSVPVDRATLEQIQSHLQRLRQLARQRGIQ